MRLFIAILLSEEMRAAIVRTQEAFRYYGVRGSYTREENLHLTLAFIGEYPDADPVLEVMEGTSPRAFELCLSGIGAFEDLWWVGVERSEALFAYVKALRHALADAGIPFDRKRFFPHITMVRKAERDGKGMPGVMIPAARMTVDHISLMRSDRGKAGMIYTELMN